MEKVGASMLLVNAYLKICAYIVILVLVIYYANALVRFITLFISGNESET